jgi:hypothetical protein
VGLASGSRWGEQKVREGKGAASGLRRVERGSEGERKGNKIGVGGRNTQTRKHANTNRIQHGGTWPKNGTVALPGLVGTAPGKGVMTIEPVSVCL